MVEADRLNRLVAKALGWRWIGEPHCVAKRIPPDCVQEEDALPSYMPGDAEAALEATGEDWSMDRQRVQDPECHYMACILSGPADGHPEGWGHSFGIAACQAIVAWGVATGRLTAEEVRDGK